MDAFLHWILIICLLLFAYPLIIYPLILLILPTKKIKSADRKINSLSILIAAYNEEDYIEGCVQSILDSNLGGIDIEILVGSDGSTDATVKVLKKIEDQRLKTFKFERQGKNETINKLVDKAKFDTILFLDADFRLKPDNIRKVINKYNQLDVGVIICPIEVLSDDDKKAKNESIYQKYESFIRKRESKISSCVNTLGSYIISKELFSKIPSDKYCDDFYSILNSISKGQRVIFDDTNALYEARTSNFFEEFGRRKRLVGGGLATITHFKKLLLPTSGLIAFFLWSHKILRWYSSYFFFLSYILSIILVHTYLGLFTSYIISILLILSAMGYLFEKNEYHNPIKLPLFFVSMNIGFIKGISQYRKGKQNAIWSRKGLN